ncbi:MAG: hypothetical protein LQ348_002827 [Seirophora lacunosa]|nr:MAG: hypothetical protein LQ348_002827 [Seirophora lacunosa]
MASEHVLRISRTDSPGDYVLLNTSSSGSSPLDLNLLATEGTEPYVKTLKHSRIPKYRTKTNHLSDQQWEQVLRTTLLQERPENPPTEPEENNKSEENASYHDVELVAAIASSKLTITVRKSISGIHQKLGELSLPADPDANINLFDWTRAAVARAEAAGAEADDLRRQLTAQTETAKRLQQHLEELIQAKQDHEDALLGKFCLLLNEKKAKIRDQQRLLATAKPDPVALKEVQKARQLHAAASSRRDPEPSRKSKRKATTTAASDEDDDDEEGGFEDQGVKVEDEGPDSEDVTPSHSNLDETEDEAEDSKDMASVHAPPTAKGKAMDEATNGAPGATEMPPRRELPFRKEDITGENTSGNNVPAGKDPDTEMANADDEETDDDEL